MIIVIDPGHGGDAKVGGSSPNNATGPSGTLEKDLTLDLATRLAPRMTAQGHRVTLTRTTDVNLGLAARAKVALDAQADLFLSIHLNGFDGPAVNGTETWIHTGASADCQTFAEAVQNRLVAVTGLRDRGVKSGRYGVLSPERHLMKTAACLAEISFLTNPEEERRLLTDAYKNALADAMMDGMLDHEAKASRIMNIAGESVEDLEDAPIQTA